MKLNPIKSIQELKAGWYIRAGIGPWGHKFYSVHLVCGKVFFRRSLMGGPREPKVKERSLLSHRFHNEEESYVDDMIGSWGNQTMDELRRRYTGDLDTDFESDSAAYEYAFTMLLPFSNKLHSPLKAAMAQGGPGSDAAFDYAEVLLGVSVPDKVRQRVGSHMRSTFRAVFL